MYSYFELMLIKELAIRVCNQLAYFCVMWLLGLIKLHTNRNRVNFFCDIPLVYNFEELLSTVVN